MLMKNVLALLAVAVAASAAPAAEPEPQQTGSQQNVCGNDQRLKCCQQLQTQRVRNGIPVIVGLQCVDINGESPDTASYVGVSLIPLAHEVISALNQQCTQRVACCSSGNQVYSKYPPLIVQAVNDVAFSLVSSISETFASQSCRDLESLSLS